ncbi:hypothetical protein KVP10_08955 [Candidimonas humi]|uniref:Uncharacterized protein n=1 Tax=Candidimonas humi TaxID=683355 RepID=A0ABV8NYH2_9BURK|nr:hypothetical protein [Candidimonas humi]MBV6305016.1 hypothetical protein [Candidimonas humi]
MRALDYFGLALAAAIFLIVLRGLIKLFVYDEFGFRLSKNHQRRIAEDRVAFDDLIEKLAPAVRAIRHQQCPRIEKVVYSFCKSDDGQLALDEIRMFDGKTDRPVDVDALPDGCKPLLKKLDNQGLRAAFVQFAKKRRSLESTDRIVIHSAGVSLVQIGSVHLPGRQLNVAVGNGGDL